MAINKKAIIDAVYLSTGVAATNPIPPTMWSYNKEVKDDPYDPDAAKKVLAANNVTVADLDLYVPHQANIRILKAVADRLRLPLEKIMLNLDRYGNTSAASIPIALDEAVREGRIKEGSLVMLGAFGAGLTWASALIRW